MPAELCLCRRAHSAGISEEQAALSRVMTNLRQVALPAGLETVAVPLSQQLGQRRNTVHGDHD